MMWVILSGFIFGYIVLMVNMYLLRLTLQQAARKEKHQAIKYLVVRNYFRFLVEGLVICLVVWLAGRTFGISCVAGMFTAKARFLWRSCVVKKISINKQL